MTDHVTPPGRVIGQVPRRRRRRGSGGVLRLLLLSLLHRSWLGLVRSGLLGGLVGLGLAGLGRVLVVVAVFIFCCLTYLSMCFLGTVLLVQLRFYGILLR